MLARVESGKYPRLFLPDGRAVKLKVRRFVPILEQLTLATALAGAAPDEDEDTDQEDLLKGCITDDEAEAPVEPGSGTDSTGLPATPDASEEEPEDEEPNPVPADVDDIDEFPDYDAYIPGDDQHHPARLAPPPLAEARDAARPGAETVNIEEGDDSQGEWDHDRTYVVPDEALVKEAKSASHLLCHRPYNPHCGICRAMRQRRRRHLRKVVPKWEDLTSLGEAVTASIS